MKVLFTSFIFIFFSIQVSFANQINLLYDTQSDGSIDPDSVWIVQMIKEAGKENEIKVNFQGAPWNRALQLVEEGIAHGVINASYKESRAKYAVYPMKDGKLDKSKSLKSPAYYFYKRKDSSFDFDGNKLINSNGLIGVNPSYAVVDNLKKLNAKVQFKRNVTSNLNSVLYKEFIATAQLENEADTVIEENANLKQNIEKLPIPVRKKEYYLIISKKYYKENPKIVHTIWDSIEKLKNTNKYKNIK